MAMLWIQRRPESNIIFENYFIVAIVLPCLLEVLMLGHRSVYWSTYSFLRKPQPPSSLIKSGLKEAKGTTARAVVNEVQMFCLETASLVGSSFQFSVWFLLSSFWPAFGCSNPLNRKWKTLQYKAAASPTGSSLSQRSSDINIPWMENP